MRFIDRTGDRYGRLEVLSLVTRKPRVRWLCKCDCGNETEVLSGHLASGKIQSCNCLRIERSVAAHEKEFNDHVVFGDVVEVRLNSGLFTIDTADLELVRQHRWYPSGGYVGTTIDGVEVRLHRFLMKPGKDEEVDHENGDRMDYRRSNLRIATRAQNAANATKLLPRNKSGYRGVHWAKSVGKWVAQTKIGGKARHLGCFDTAEDAARAYNDKVKEIHGEFATKLNKIEELRCL